MFALRLATMRWYSPILISFITSAEQYYIRTGLDAPDRAGTAAPPFDHLIFDEFHVFQAPQAVAVINALLFIHAITGATRPRKFVFPATPNSVGVFSGWFGGTRSLRGIPTARITLIRSGGASCMGVR
jgi:hypothetical protein